MDAVECGTLFSGLISLFVFEVLQIPRGRSAPTCIPWLRAWFLPRVLRRLLQATLENVEIVQWSIIIIIIIIIITICCGYRFVM